MEAMTIVRRTNGAEAWLDAGLAARRLDRPRMVKAARVALGGSILDRTPPDASRGAAGALRWARAAVPEIAAPGLQRGASRGWTVLAVAALHCAALAVAVLTFLAAGLTLWLG